MKNKLKYGLLVIALSLSFTLISIQNESVTKISYAEEINKNSAFYRSKKTRDAYLALTSEQRKELDMMNTDNKMPLTIEEVLATGKYKLPIRKGVDWLYPFMLDKNKNGEVGENYIGPNNGSQSKDSPTTIVQETTVEENTNIVVPINPLIVEKTNDNLEIAEGITEETRLQLIEAITNANKQIDAAEYLMENFPKTIAKVVDKLEFLIKDSKETIKMAEELLAKN
ncbi:hypothetical protein [Anaerococcus sp. Marseille-P9784]|uniref:hypothetical protein n=1 Tax=Anaerococcus sp. Marseille-P9784 TaxID=2614127 RepID=UPI00124A6915|nr:hypothetical protein [Anaerococcus sp. Marseille-P9784]